MSKFDEILSKVKELKRQERIIHELRDIWYNIYKSSLIRHLKRYTDEVFVGWKVQENDILYNKSTVVLYCPKTPSGIVKKDNQPYKHYVKYGAQLAFGQLVNGLIVVMVVYPYIEELLPPIPDKKLATLNPKELTNERIDELLLQFLDELIWWETQEIS